MIKGLIKKGRAATEAERAEEKRKLTEETIQNVIEAFDELERMHDKGPTTLQEELAGIRESIEKGR